MKFEVVVKKALDLEYGDLFIPIPTDSTQEQLDAFIASLTNFTQAAIGVSFFVAPTWGEGVGPGPEDICIVLTSASDDLGCQRPGGCLCGTLSRGEDES